MSRASSNGTTAPISSPAQTRTCPNTAPVSCSTAATTATAAPLPAPAPVVPLVSLVSLVPVSLVSVSVSVMVPAEPRRVLPSTAKNRRPGPRDGARAAAQAANTGSSTSASRRPSTRRNVDSEGAPRATPNSSNR